MRTLDVVADAPIGDGTNQNRFPGAVIILRVTLGGLFFGVPLDFDQVERRRGKVRDLAAFLMGDVPRHGQRLQVNLRACDRRADVQENPAFELRDGLREDEKVGEAGGPQCGAVAVGMGMNNVAADADV